MAHLSEVGEILVVLVPFSVLKNFDRRREIRRCVWLSDGDIDGESVTIGDGEVRFGCALVIDARFDSGAGTGVASMTVESLDDEVVASENGLAACGRTAHGVGEEVG